MRSHGAGLRSHSQVNRKGAAGQQKNNAQAQAAQVQRPESPVREVNLVSIESANQAVNAQSAVKKAMDFSVEKVVQKPGSKARKLRVEEMVAERIKIQPELLKAYPDMPVLDTTKTYNWTDYAYAAHDQIEFLVNAMTEIKSMHESHFMTKKNKELIREKKRLEEELSLAQSQGPAAAQGEVEMVEQMRKQLDASQKAHRITTQRITEIESQYQGVLDQEKTKGKQTGQKLARIEADKERLSQ